LTAPNLYQRTFPSRYAVARIQRMNGDHSADGSYYLMHPLVVEATLAGQSGFIAAPFGVTWSGYANGSNLAKNSSNTSGAYVRR
jgi:hypothetical protein